MPLSLIVYDDAANKKGSEAFAQGDGPPRGRELEIADLLRFIKTSGVANTVWLTADVHYAAAHYYNPDKAQFQEFEPFWEFVSGPLHAGTFGPNELDNTFGPEVKFIKAPGLDKQNLPPSAGMQFFGHVKIDGASRADDGDACAIAPTWRCGRRRSIRNWDSDHGPKPADGAVSHRRHRRIGVSTRLPARRSNRASAASACPRTPPEARHRRHIR